MAQPKRRVTLIFFFIYAIFGLILAYLLFFNLGLEFQRQVNDGQTAVYLKNTSLHLIRDINLLDAQGRVVQSISQLQPGEQTVINLQLFSGNKLMAMAPFHAPAELTLASGGNLSNLTAPKLTYTTTYPVPAIVNQLFPISFNVCNSGQQSAEINLSYAFDIQYFSSASAEQTAAINGAECKDLSFQFTPLKAGDSSIQFSLRYGDHTEQIPVGIQSVGS